MNDKFYALPEEKQSQILNAAYKVFATNQYKNCLLYTSDAADD